MTDLQFKGSSLRIKSIILVLTMIFLISGSCSIPTTTPATTASPTSTLTTTPSPTTTYNQYQLEYRLLAAYPDIFWCDPDIYPVAQEGQEQANAIEQFPSIMANASEFSAILEHLALPHKADYTDADKLDIYREHKLLTRAAMITASGDIYNFNLRTGENPGWYVEGTITSRGQIRELKRETSFNTCPICLTKGTLIDTPNGELPVEEIKPGMIVWTKDKTGGCIAAPVIKISNTQVSPSFQVIKLTLNDGRWVMASPGHPAPDMRCLGDYHVGDRLDGGLVVSIESLNCPDKATYDILPGGETGLYRANGILLMTTLTRNPQR
jgi:hypothetical protein